MINIRYPAIKGPSRSKNFTIPGGRVEISDPQPADQVAQIQSYLHQLVDDLNYALNSIEAQTTEAKNVAAIATSGKSEETKAQSTFGAIKSLIIKSADIVNAYYEEINKRLQGQYVAQSEFGTFVEQTTNEISATSTEISQMYTDLQQIISDVEETLQSLAYIKTGLLYYNDPLDKDNYTEDLPDGAAVFGLEIGQSSEQNGVEVFNKFARFTSSELAFFDNNGTKVAYVSNEKLYITHVEVTGSFAVGGFVDTVLSDKSVVTRWVTGGEN